MRADIHATRRIGQQGSLPTFAAPAQTVPKTTDIERFQNTLEGPGYGTFLPFACLASMSAYKKPETLT
jgi:hypothetical protein